jgi:phage gp46-like protein
MITDFASSFDNDLMQGDLSFTQAGLFENESSLRTAILHSLLGKARISTEEMEIYQVDEPGGWWGSQLTGKQNDNYGSKRWVLRRAKANEQTRRLYEQFTRESLAWLITDGLAQAVDYESEWGRPGQLLERITVTLSTGRTEQFDLITRSL